MTQLLATEPTTGVVRELVRDALGSRTSTGCLECIVQITAMLSAFAERRQHGQTRFVTFTLDVGQHRLRLLGGADKVGQTPTWHVQLLDADVGNDGLGRTDSLSTAQMVLLLLRLRGRQ